jgi:hypothetical protein
MRHSRRIRRASSPAALVGPGLLTLLVCGSALVSFRPALAQSSDEAWAPVTIVYTSDVKGHIEPCG